jgi:hypothetical protein
LMGADGLDFHDLGAGGLVSYYQTRPRDHVSTTEVIWMSGLLKGEPHWPKTVTCLAAGVPTSRAHAANPPATTDRPFATSLICRNGSSGGVGLRRAIKWQAVP